MAHLEILFLGCFSNLSIYQFSIPNEPLYHLTQLRLDCEDETSITTHIYDFLKFCESHEIDDEEFACAFFFLTLEGRVNQWCHTLPPTSILYSHHFLKDIYHSFDRYDY